MVDLHCHILPGLDDGPATLDDALAMARMAAADGVQVIVATPHVQREYRFPAPDLIREAAARLDKAVRAEQLPLRILPGAEIPAEPELLEALQAGRLLTVGDRGRHVLIELPSNAPAIYAPELFFRLQVAGYTPIVAHVERAVIFRHQPAMLREFHERGIQLQLNVDSLSAGWSTRRYARQLVRDGLVDLLASDGHDLKRRQPVLTPARRVLPPDLFEKLTVSNPARLLRRDNGEENAVTASPNSQTRQKGD